MTFALPLCPPDGIDALALAEAELHNLASPRIKASSREYLQYIRNTYMVEEYRKTDGSWDWNFYNRITFEHMTNNPSEGGNNRLRIRARTDHPNIFAFGSLLKKELRNTLNKMEQYEQGNLEPYVSKRSQQLQKSRNKLKTMLENDELLLRKYLRSQGVLAQQTKPKNKKQVDGRAGVEGAVRGALVSVTDDTLVEQEVGEAGAGVGVQRVRGRRGGFAAGTGRARGVRGRGAAPTHRICPSCGGNYRTSYLRIHQRRHCHGPGEEEDDDDNDEEIEDVVEVQDDEEVTDGLEVDEVLDVVAEVEQTVAGIRQRRGIVDSDDEDEVETLTRRIRQQRLQAERRRPEDDDNDLPPAQRSRVSYPSRNTEPDVESGEGAEQEPSKEPWQLLMQVQVVP